eukprot:827431_1
MAQSSEPAGWSLNKHILSLLQVNGNGWNVSLFEDQNELCGNCKEVSRDAVELGCDHDDDVIMMMNEVEIIREFKTLCTHFGTIQQWHNPMELGLVTVQSSNGWQYGEAKDVVARDENGCIIICFNVPVHMFYPTNSIHMET